MNDELKRPDRARSRVLFGVVAVAGVLVVALAIQFARGDVPPQVAASPSPSGSASGVPSATPGASTGASPTVPALPSPSALPSSAVVRVTNKLPASGQWALILRRHAPIEPGSEVFIDNPARDSISAVPLAGGQEIRLLEFVGIPKQQRLGVANLLREELSPDGRRVVLSVANGEGPGARLVLAIVDLVAGTASQLTNDEAYNDNMPAWGPRGDQIAFMRTPTGGLRDATIWTIRPDGTGLRQVVGQPYTETTAIFGWNADGTLIGLFRGTEGSRYNVLDPATGSATTIGDRFMLFGPSADWREGSPAFVGAFTETPRGGAQYIVTADQRGRDAMTIVTVPAAPNTYVAGARWRPGSDDILYIRFSFEPTSNAGTTTLYVTNASGRTPRAAATSSSGFMGATWTADGRDIVYLSVFDSGARLSLIAADGSNDRTVLAFGTASGTRTEWLQLALLSF